MAPTASTPPRSQLAPRSLSPRPPWRRSMMYTTLMLPLSQPWFHAMLRSSATDSRHSEWCRRSEVTSYIEAPPKALVSYLLQPFTTQKWSLYGQHAPHDYLLKLIDPKIATQPAAKLNSRKRACNAPMYAKLGAKDLPTVAFAPSDRPRIDVVSGMTQNYSSTNLHTQRDSVRLYLRVWTQQSKQLRKRESQFNLRLWKSHIWWSSSETSDSMMWLCYFPSRLIAYELPSICRLTPY